MGSNNVAGRENRGDGNAAFVGAARRARTRDLRWGLESLHKMIIITWRQMLISTLLPWRRFVRCSVSPPTKGRDSELGDVVRQ